MAKIKVKPGVHLPAVHWRAPVTMLVAFIAGILFAAGHHVFYHNLDGQAVSEAKYDQQMNIRIGTVLSYLVRAALVVAIGVAYWQMFWRTLLHSALPVSAIDSLADLLGSLLSFFDIAALRANPVLFMLAALSWLIPFTAVVTPATLTVSTAQVVSHKMHHLPAMNFATGPMATTASLQVPDSMAHGGMVYILGYDGSSQLLSRLALATALQGEIPNIPPPAENSSYRLDFDAPGVQCKRTSRDILKGFDSVMGCPFFEDGGPENPCGPSWYYMAWTPTADDIIPFGKGSIPYGRRPLPISRQVDGVNHQDSYLGSYNTEPATIYIAAGDPGKRYGEWNVLNCTLWNTTYTVDFDFPASGQRISTLGTRFNHPVSVDWLTELGGGTLADDPTHGPGLSYQSLMECLGKLLVGSVFQDIVYGLVNSGSALQTDVAYTREVFPAYSATIAATETYDVAVRDALRSPQFDRPLAAVIEEMFQNMTLALFSNKVFLGNATLPADVAVRSMQNVYEYSPSNLLLAYCLAIGFTLVAIVLGFGSLWASEASYSNKFSTIIRTMCDASLSTLVASEDRKGADPLPKYLGKLKVQGGAGVAPASDDEAAESSTENVKPSVPVDENSTMLGREQSRDAAPRADTAEGREGTGWWGRVPAA